MNPDPQSIRIQVAREMEWRKESFGPLIQDYRWHKPDGSPTHIEPPDYPTDANAALTLAAKLKSEGWHLSIFMTHEGRWVCDFIAGLGGITHRATASTFPMALCLAFLAVRKSQKPESNHANI